MGAAATKRLLAETQIRQRLPEPERRRRVRERLGVSQGEVARALGVAPSTISRYESGERTPRRQLLASYVELLDALTNEAPASATSPGLPKGDETAPRET